MSETSGLYCYSGYRPRDESYSSLEVQKSQIMRGRFGCKASINVNALDIRTTTLNAQNVVVNNSLNIAGASVYGIFSFSAGSVPYNITSGNWEFPSSTALPYSVDESQNVSLVDTTATVTASGFYVVSFNSNIVTSASTAFGWSVNSADPTFTFAVLPTTAGSLVNDTTTLYLNSGDTLQLGVQGSAAETITFNDAEWSIATRGY